MTLLEVECDVRQNVQLQKLKDAHLLTAYTSIPYSPEKLALSLFIAEFYHALRSEQQDNRSSCLRLRPTCSGSTPWEVGFANFHLTLLMRMSRFLGFYPNLDDYVDGCVFDLRTATFSLQVPTHRDFLDSHDSQLIHTLMRMDFPHDAPVPVVTPRSQPHHGGVAPLLSPTHSPIPRTQEPRCPSELWAE